MTFQQSFVLEKKENLLFVPALTIMAVVVVRGFN